jgi:hypothetical protein
MKSLEPRPDAAQHCKTNWPGNFNDLETSKPIMRSRGRLAPLGTHVFKLKCTWMTPFQVPGKTRQHLNRLLQAIVFSTVQTITKVHSTTRMFYSPYIVYQIHLQGRGNTKVIHKSIDFWLNCSLKAQASSLKFFTLPVISKHTHNSEISGFCIMVPLERQAHCSVFCVHIGYTDSSF